MAKNAPETAKMAAIFRTIPKNRTVVSVTAANAQLDLTPYAGQYIWLQALTLQVEILLGTTPLGAVPSGFPLKTTDPLFEVFVDQNDALALQHRSSGAASLVIYHG